MCSPLFSDCHSHYLAIVSELYGNSLSIGFNVNLSEWFVATRSCSTALLCEAAPVRCQRRPSFLLFFFFILFALLAFPTSFFGEFGRVARSVGPRLRCVVEHLGSISETGIDGSQSSVSTTGDRQLVSVFFCFFTTFRSSPAVVRSLWCRRVFLWASSLSSGTGS